MSTTLPPGVSAAVGAGRVDAQYPYAPVNPGGRQLYYGTVEQREQMLRQYLPVPESVVRGSLGSAAAMRRRAEERQKGKGEFYSKRMIPLRDPAEAMTLARQLLTYHRAYGLWDVHDALDPQQAEHTARAILGEWRSSGRTSIHVTPDYYSPPGMQGGDLYMHTQLPEMSPQEKWQALQREMRDLQDSLVQVDTILPPPCICPSDKEVAYRQGTWASRSHTESEEEPVKLGNEEPPAPPTVLDSDGKPIDPDKEYYVADSMTPCGVCGVLMLKTSRYCHWCQARVYLECADCKGKTRVPLRHCLHCEQMLPKYEPHLPPLRKGDDVKPDAQDRVYFLESEMLRCGKCRVRMLKTANYCHWCSMNVFKECIVCGERTRMPATMCHMRGCGHMLPTHEQRVGGPTAAQVYSKPASELKVPDALEGKINLEEAIAEVDSKKAPDGKTEEVRPEPEKEAADGKEKEKDKEGDNRPAPDSPRKKKKKKKTVDADADEQPPAGDAGGDEPPKPSKGDDSKEDDAKVDGEPPAKDAGDAKKGDDSAEAKGGNQEDAGDSKKGDDSSAVKKPAGKAAKPKPKKKKAAPKEVKEEDEGAPLPPPPPPPEEEP